MNRGTVGTRPYPYPMDESYLAALSMAALEVLPAQPSDLTSLLGDPDAREVLLKLSPSGRTSELLGWL